MPDRPLHLVDSGGDLPQLGRTLRCELGVLTSTDAAYGGGDRRQGDHQPAADEERRDRGHDERHPDRQHEGPRRGDPARVDRRLDVLEPRVDRAVELVEAVAHDVEASLRSPGLDERIGQLRVARANGIDFAFRFTAPLCDCLLYSRERKWVATVRLDLLELGDERLRFGLPPFVGLEEVVAPRDHESPLPGLLVDVGRPQPSRLL